MYLFGSQNRWANKQIQHSFYLSTHPSNFKKTHYMIFVTCDQLLYRGKYITFEILYPVLLATNENLEYYCIMNESRCLSLLHTFRPLLAIRYLFSYEFAAWGWVWSVCPGEQWCSLRRKHWEKENILRRKQPCLMDQF